MPRNRPWLTFAVAAFAAKLAFAAEPKPFPSIPPKSPAEALKTFRLLEGFRMDLLAAEPVVTDPVDMVYDENGLAYVVEMSDYPYTDAKAHEAWKDNTTDAPIGRVRILEDTDGDWKFDRGTIFAEGLSWPTGIACWKGGVFVLATPDIWYFKDTDGDRRADIKRKVFTGFRKYNVQAVMNNPKWGLDHRLHIAGSSNGGSIRPGGEADSKPAILRRNDFAIDPDTGDFEILAGGARFGNTFDDWGNRFICNIRNPVQHAVLPNRYLARNKHLPVRGAIHDVAESGDRVPVYPISPPEPWRAFRARQWATLMDRQYPRSELAPQGYFTSSSGLTIYRGSAYPRSFHGNVFIGEVANNLTHRQILEPDGVTFKATPAHEKVEFLASTDNWFRPVNYLNAPDGTLHICDMYRENIEHPWSIPDDIRARLDLESGRDRGRIYRLTPPGDFKPGKPPRLGKASTKELIALLAHPNAWQRETAHRLIFERQPKDAVNPLRDMLQQHPSPLARLHALYSLQGLGSLSDEDLLTGLRDKSPRVKEHAIRLSESRLKDSSALLAAAVKLSVNDDIRVRFQLAFSLGEAPSPEATKALAVIAAHNPGDSWIETAVLSSAHHDPVGLYKQSFGFAGRERATFIRSLARIIGARGDGKEIWDVFNAAQFDARSTSTTMNHTLLGLHEGAKRARKSLSELLAPLGSLANQQTGILRQAKDEALDESIPAEYRSDSIRLLALTDLDQAEPIYRALLGPGRPSAIHDTAIQTLATHTGERVAAILLAGWQSYLPPTRKAALGALMARSDRIPALLDAIESGAVPLPQITATRRTLLLRNRDPKLRDRAAAIFADSRISPRKQVLADYQSALRMTGDRGRGKQVYESACMACHRFAGQGNTIGPDLSTVSNRTADELLVHIVDPNREVSPNYIQYNIDLKDDESLSGIIAEETANSIVVKTADNQSRAVLRSEIREIRASGLSLMPEGLEAAIDKQGMADLLAYLLRR